MKPPDSPPTDPPSAMTALQTWGADIALEGSASEPHAISPPVLLEFPAAAGNPAVVQERVGTDEFLLSLHTWQDEVSSKLADLALLRPIHEGLRSLHSTMHTLRQELKNESKVFSETLRHVSTIESEVASFNSSNSGGQYRHGKTTRAGTHQGRISANPRERHQTPLARLQSAATVCSIDAAPPIGTAYVSEISGAAADDETGDDKPRYGRSVQFCSEDTAEDAERRRPSLMTDEWDPTLMNSGRASGASFVHESSNPSLFSAKTLKFSRFQIHPDSAVCTAWDLLSVVALLFDSVMIPFIIAWSPEVEGFILGAMWATAVFWSIDVLINLSKGYFTASGDLEYRPRKILLRYLKQTMIIDMLICTTDWAGIALEGQKAKLNSKQGDVMGLIRIIKANRIVRIVRVLRISHIWDKLEGFNRYFLSNTAQVLMQVTVLFLFIVWFGHLLCCCWFAIGTGGSNSDTGIGWLDGPINQRDRTPIKDATMLYQYVTAYHWSMSQLTPGSMEVFPMNSGERAFTIIILLLGLLFCSSLISRLSALMVQLQIANQDRARIIKKVRTFMRQNSISASTAARIEKYIKAKLNSKGLLSMEDIPILERLSKPLLRDMRFDMFSVHMLCQPFFSSLDSMSFKVTRAVCEVLDLCHLTLNEELFGTGMDTRMSYLLVSGSLLYMEEDPTEQEHRQSTMAMQSTLNMVSEVKEKYSWLSSAALWMAWTTKGYAEANDNCEVICLDGKAILEAVDNTSRRAATFLQHYQKALRSLWQTNSSEKVNDIIDPVDHALVVLSLSKDVRMEISEPLFEVIRQKNWLRWGSAKAIKELHDEVSMGKCALIASSGNTPVRVAIVIALRVRRPGGEVLMEVAQIEKGKCTPLARYPATKLQQHEAPRDAARRALNRLTEDLDWNVDPNRSTTSQSLVSVVGMDIGELDSVEVEWKTSPSYGLQTQYRRNIFAVLQTGSKTDSPPLLQFETARPSAQITTLMSTSAALSEFMGMSASAFQEEPSEREALDGECPYLVSHHSSHIHWLRGVTKTTAYAWIREDDIESLIELVQGASGRGRVET